MVVSCLSDGSLKRRDDLRAFEVIRASTKRRIMSPPNMSATQAEYSCVAQTFQQSMSRHLQKTFRPTPS